jgi:pimeloyl-ACP methyl ester carboxylesterase
MVQVKGGEVWVDDAGAGGGAAAGPPVALLHAGVGDSRLWEPVLPGLAAGRLRVIRYDARGFGRSPAPTVSYTRLDDLRSVLDHFELTRVVLVGSSMGGRTAIDLALSDPGRMAALGLLVPGVNGYDGLESAKVTEEIGRLATAGDMDGLVRSRCGSGARRVPTPTPRQSTCCGRRFPRGSRPTATRPRAGGPSTGWANSTCPARSCSASGTSPR